MTRHVTLISKNDSKYQELCDIKIHKTIPHNKGDDVQIGSSYRMLTAIKIEKINQKRTIVYIKCDCGNYGFMPLYLFRCHNLRSCGCQLRVCNSHGFSRSRIYSIWRGINNRCSIPTCTTYSKYGGRGIKVCKEWERNTPNAFMNFYNWSIENGYNNLLTIDRIDPTKDYTPSNCRWATYNQQNSHLQIKKNKSGYRGVKEYIGIKGIYYYPKITVEGKEISLGHYTHKKDAVEARNKYIIDNQLDYPIQEWIGEEGYKKKGE